MSEILISNLIGLFIGIVTSFLTWWILFHGIIPKIRFSEHISKLLSTDEKAGWKYRFKFVNCGRRALLDVQVVARLSIKGLHSPDSWTTITIPLELSHDKKYEIPRVPRNANRVLRLFVNQVVDLKQSALFPNDLREKAKNDVLCLEELLALGTESKLLIYVSGYDAFSGARKMFASKGYTVADIREGQFKGLQVLVEASESTKAGKDINRTCAQQDAPAT